MLWNLRAWACCCRGRRLPAEPVVAAFANIGAPAAAEALDAAMTRLVLATGRPLAVHCPPHPGLSDDELTLLAAAAAAQRHDRDALTGLFADLLSPPASALSALAHGVRRRHRARRRAPAPAGPAARGRGGSGGLARRHPALRGAT